MKTYAVLLFAAGFVCGCRTKQNGFDPTTYSGNVVAAADYVPRHFRKLCIVPSSVKVAAVVDNQVQTFTLHNCLPTKKGDVLSLKNGVQKSIVQTAGNNDPEYSAVQ